MMAEPIDQEAFAVHIGDAFAVAAGERTVALQLVEVKKFGSAAGAGRQPFSLLFLGPAAPVLPQRIHPLRHPELGALEIFLVPIGGAVGPADPEARGMRYEAIFN